ncbi:hypothetical protein BCR42DRAFT_126436 [Absidia repens]|uniref:Uncharacterized protein n=1 Tax=Absidia repens TaxID=90262 RepID=A0A1X2IV73_9FUNG|nr:hypothetical protein BCR42DRAFT_126436 [Absidia repens]
MIPELTHALVRYNSWEPEENLYCPALVKAYHARVNKTNRLKVAPKRKRSSPKPTTTEGRQNPPVTTMKNYITIPSNTVRKHIRKRPSLLVSMSLSKPAAQAHLIPAAPIHISTKTQPSSSKANGEVDTTGSPPLVIDSDEISSSDTNDTNTGNINSKKQRIRTTDLSTISMMNLREPDEFEITKRQKKSPQKATPLLDDLIDNLERTPTSTNDQKTPPRQPLSPPKLTNSTSQSRSDVSGNPSTTYTFAAQSSNQRSQQNSQQHQNSVWTKYINLKSFGTFGLQLVLTHDPWQLENNLSLFMKDAEMTLTSVVPFNRTQCVCQQNNYCVMKIVPIKVNFPNWSKLGRFLYINRQYCDLRADQPKRFLLPNNSTWKLGRWKKMVHSALYMSTIWSRIA